MVSTLFYNIYTWPSLNVQVLRQAMVQVWHPIHWLMLSAMANCLSGRCASYGYSISRLTCQLKTFGILRHIALNQLKKETISKLGVKAKGLKTAWSGGYLLNVLDA
ncbi:MAG: hypothetical protein IIC24_11885 [Chloroflexi bacterium]|nr:hypothetical protein [Chloroflexota bacterium]